MKKFGRLPSKFNFSLNPYPEFRYSKCPDCDKATGQRKRPLFIHIDPLHPFLLNYTHRYCSRCDMLIGHKHEIEHHLTMAFEKANPKIIGNEYILLGTIENKAWKKNAVQPLPLNELSNYVHDFKTFQIISLTMGGWFQKDVEPPIIPHPASTEWIKNSV